MSDTGNPVPADKTREPEDGTTKENLVQGCEILLAKILR